MIRKIIDFLLFSSLYIAGCAVLMVYQTLSLTSYPENVLPIYGFVFCSTVCSYNLHWYFTPIATNERIRSRWTQQHRPFQLYFSIAGAIGALYFLSFLMHALYWLIPSAVLTFLYTAPKLPLKGLAILKRLAIGKTIYLAFVWTYVTAMMPLLIVDIGWTAREWLFAAARFFFIYSICILFDYRDREQDKKEGIRSLVTYFEEKGIDRLFVGSMLIFCLTTLCLYYFNLGLWVIITMLLSGLALIFLYPIAKRNFSDYLYYFVLDGLMMFSALCTVLLPI